MNKVRGKKFRCISEEILKELSKIYCPIFGRKFQIHQVDECLSHMRSIEKNAVKANVGYLTDEFSLAYLSSACIALLAMSVYTHEEQNQLFEGNWLSENSVPNPNFVLQCLLTQAANYVSGTISLLERGLDNPARANCRLVYELTMQSLVLMYSRENFRRYIMGHDEETSAQIWQELFAKGRLNKKLEEIEKSMGFDEQLITIVSEERKSSYKFYSQAVHHSFIASTVGAYAPSFVDEGSDLGVMGGENRNIVPTLKYLNFTMWYFLLSFFAILDKHHNIKPKAPKNSLWMETFMLYFCVKKGYLGIYKSGI